MKFPNSKNLNFQLYKHRAGLISRPHRQPQIHRVFLPSRLSKIACLLLSFFIIIITISIEIYSQL